ncbi:MAG: hypothetical protein RMA76_07330 [Deltaproteobacteria bacterium]|jgi:hypothetical protein
MSHPRRSNSLSDTTQPSEIPTALIEEPFDGDDDTQDKTLDMTDEDRGDDSKASKKLEKFRRPTKSEILEAVDQVKTESIDVFEVAEARAAQRDTADVDEDDDD